MYRVLRNGKYIGIIETNLPFARAYWAERQRITGARFRLELI